MMKTMKKIYEKLYSRKGPYHWGPSLFKTEKVYTISRWLKNCVMILDVGTGDGGLLSEISRLLPQSEIVGSDISSKAISLAKEKLPAKSFIVADAEHLPFRECCFDGCYSSEVIEHLFHPNKMLLNCLEVLKHGGKMVITTPNSKTFLREGERVRVHLHVKEYNWQELGQLFRENGFKVNTIVGIRVRFRGYGTLYRFFSWLKCKEIYLKLLQFFLGKLYPLASTLAVCAEKS